jgi:xanthosine utilization system XapX-like protein
MCYSTHATTPLPLPTVTPILPHNSPTPPDPAVRGMVGTGVGVVELSAGAPVLDEAKRVLISCSIHTSCSGVKATEEATEEATEDVAGGSTDPGFAAKPATLLLERVLVADAGLPLWRLQICGMNDSTRHNNTS